MSGKDSALGGLIAFILGVLGAAVVLKIIDEASKEKRYVCPTCGNALRRGMIRCSKCRTSLRWA